MRFKGNKFFLITAAVVVSVFLTTDLVCSSWATQDGSILHGAIQHGSIQHGGVVIDRVAYADPWIVQRFPCLGVFLPNAFWNWLSDLGLIAPTLAKLRSLH